MPGPIDARGTEDPHPFPGALAGRRAVVMGLGRFGGGEAVARHLRRRGADVLVTDLRPAEELERSIAGLTEAGVTFRLGEHEMEDFTAADLVVVNPAVPHPWDNPFLLEARAGGARLLTEIRLAIGDHPAERVIGITGSAGKSTTAAMVQHALLRIRPDLRSRLGGNIGGSLLDDPPAADSTLVLELSSFMLHWIAGDAGEPEDRFTPGVALVTNIAPNHLDWHRSLEHYAASKQAILTGSPACPAPRPVDASRCTWRADVLSELELAVPGSHNRDNAIDAIATIIEHLTLVDGEMADPRATASACAAALRDFPGLPHRLEFVGEHRGIRFFNDSKSTTPGATGLAVESMSSTRRTHLIAGGYDKGSDLEPVARLARDLAGLYGIGATEAAICEHGGEACGTLAKAFERAVASAGEGDVVLLSPGCASWDQFTDFEVRGRTFRELVERLD
ncbi:MAG: UDP-N-acetylmuramoyl-L-alanine--D-glutamate ligase [Phycisphaeraceae bacterium]|nr:UDP-N-acetylmuramoyl-L-alanine--D-glutamate ligase [Phycisphaeraceae bacterium]